VARSTEEGTLGSRQLRAECSVSLDFAVTRDETWAESAKSSSNGVRNSPASRSSVASATDLGRHERQHNNNATPSYYSRKNAEENYIVSACMICAS
jgi:hypothetical protein